jgi:glycosyltransferase involved in cell wall biosynthesis
MQLYKELNLENEVHFSGAIAFKDVLHKYKTADIFVLPCVISGDGSTDITPNSIIEAMAAKLPVISTTITAIPEIIENRVSGILVEPHDAAALATQIIRLTQDANLRQMIGENARKRVEEKFGIEKNVKFLKELFIAS